MKKKKFTGGGITLLVLAGFLLLPLGWAAYSYRSIQATAAKFPATETVTIPNPIPAGISIKTHKRAFLNHRGEDKAANRLSAFNGTFAELGAIARRVHLAPGSASYEHDLYVWGFPEDSWQYIRIPIGAKGPLGTRRIAWIAESGNSLVLTLDDGGVAESLSTRKGFGLFVAAGMVLCIGIAFALRDPS